MLRVAAPMGLMFSAALALSLAGCNSKTPHSSPTQRAEQAKSGHDTHTEHAHEDHADYADIGTNDMDSMKAELAKLAPDDAASAERQHFCLVSGEMLGTMGAPKKIEVNGQHVWICCDGCEDKLLANPDEYLAKLRSE